MIKVLHVVSSLDGGGVESMLYNYYMHMDRQKIKFDFIVHGDSIGILEKEVNSLGSKIFHVVPKKISFIRNILEINKILRNEKYDIVHCHQNFSNFSTLFLAKKNQVPIRISHAHGYKETRSFKELIRNHFLRLINKFWANYFLSCGIDAGKWLHGKKWYPSEKNVIINNAIDTKKFSYNLKIRETYRKILNVQNKTVLLHVGRFSNEKNHLFMIDIIEYLSQQNNDKYILLFAGDGPIKNAVKKHVEKKNVEDKVIFLGVRNDVMELMNAADVFLFPSKHEGFGIVTIEAQSTGLGVLASDRVTKETAVTNLIEFLPIENAVIWANKVSETKILSRRSREVDVGKKGYSINEQAIKYSQWLERITT
ncbi:glycosyltransferase family 1 protein [Domibacillus indicus]|uniref:glycosyltransferase family 1 protein n=1 Tax=Domibacillus indicus TaxID=1437523 RepID=UPI00203E7929|nr:glycosyltransferase family 1 protein [Domibacillus indicus]MCM3788888.1 glycosyltransferase family 1 protein [Domibacillus indicus]